MPAVLSVSAVPNLPTVLSVAAVPRMSAVPCFFFKVCLLFLLFIECLLFSVSSLVCLLFQNYVAAVPRVPTVPLCLLFLECLLFPMFLVCSQFACSISFQ